MAMERSKKGIVRAAGHHVDGGSTRQRAEGLIDRDGYDLVIADGKLDSGTGMMIADKAVAKGSKALIITGAAMQLPQEHLLRYLYLLKPIRGAQLLSHVDRLLGGAAEP
jgi:DNA-binding response OmpR family regulator